MHPVPYAGGETELKKIEEKKACAELQQDRREDRRRYERPTLTKKRSVSRVTLFSGGGVVAGGLTASG